jgi:hypothetical protein
MEPLAVVEHLDVLEDRTLGDRSSWQRDAIDEFLFERREERFSDSVVPALTG